MSDVPNSISLAPFDRKDWIVRTEKHNRYKLVNYKQYHKRLPGRARSGKTVFAYDKGDSLTLVQMGYSPTQNGGTTKFHASTLTAFALKIKDGRVIIWSVSGGQTKTIRNFSNRVCAVEKALFGFGQRNIYKGKIPKEEDEEVLPSPPSNDDIADLDWSYVRPQITRHRRYQEWPELLRTEKRVIKAAVERLNKVLIHFLKRNGIKFKYTNNPFENLRIACYPLSADFSLKEQWLNPFFSRHFIHGDIKYVVKKCFGSDGAKIVRLVCEEVRKTKSLDCLLVGSLLRGLVPLDFFYTAIGNTPLERLKTIVPARIGNLRMKDCRTFLKRFNAQRILKLVTSQDFGTVYFPDTISMFTQLADPNIELPEKPKSWRELHDALALARRKHQDKLNSFPLPVKDDYKVVDGAIVNHLTLEVPKHTDQLRAYSDQMSNCIWSYGHQVKSGHCDLLGVYRDGRLAYNISIVNKHLSQFSGQHNSPPDPEDKKLVVNFLEQKGILQPVTVKLAPLDNNILDDW